MSCQYCSRPVYGTYVTYNSNYLINISDINITNIISCNTQAIVKDIIHMIPIYDWSYMIACIWSNIWLTSYDSRVYACLYMLYTHMIPIYGSLYMIAHIRSSIWSCLYDYRIWLSVYAPHTYDSHIWLTVYDCIHMIKNMILCIWLPYMTVGIWWSDIWFTYMAVIIWLHVYDQVYDYFYMIPVYDCLHMLHTLMIPIYGYRYMIAHIWSRIRLSPYDFMHMTVCIWWSDIWSCIWLSVYDYMHMIKYMIVVIWFHAYDC